MTMLPAALTFMLEHTVGSISAIPVIGVIFSADLRIAMRGWPLPKERRQHQVADLHASSACL